MKHVLCVGAMELLMTFQQGCTGPRKAAVVGESTALDADLKAGTLIINFTNANTER